MISGLGVVLAVTNAITAQNDVRMATGTVGEAQERFFVDAADRPDIAIFFKGLAPDQRLKMSQSVGEYDDPKIAVLIGKLLADFDFVAREALTDSLVKLVKKQPKAVAEQLALKGSFQQLAVAKALATLGPTSAPFAAATLSNADARPNAVGYLVDLGSPSVPVLLPLLKDASIDVRLAAADGLGKLRSREAIPELTRLYREMFEKSKQPEAVAVPGQPAPMTLAAISDARAAYLTAISGIGDPGSEPLLVQILANPAEPSTLRAQAALGIGRIASVQGARLLWNYRDDDEFELRESILSALQLAGGTALSVAPPLDESVIRVAGGIKGTAAEQVIAAGLRTPALVEAAALAATDRPSLVPNLLSVLRAPAARQDGRVADAAIRALRSTDQGELALRNSPEMAIFAGLIDRQKRLNAG